MTRAGALLSSLLVVVAAVAVLASPVKDHDANAAERVDMGKEGDRLISLNPEVPPTWMSHGQVERMLIRKGVRFMDVTEHPDEHKQPRVLSRRAFPTAPSHGDEVKQYLPLVDIAVAEANLVVLSSFFTRYYLTETGEQSAEWVFNKVQEYAALSEVTNITVSQFVHNGYNQKSVIAAFPGQDPSQPTVVIGAHQDSVNVNNPTGGRSPGADDDGSGTVTILEAFRVLVANGFNPVYPVEFQWYAAEEAGLLGSQDIAAAYREEDKPIYGMFQLDMTGYTPLPPQPVRVIQDYVDAELSAFTEQLIDTYTSLERRTHSCGYGCSDHASYNRSGYPSATTFEPVTCPQIHQVGDDLDLIVWDQVQQFVYLAISYVVELSHGPN